jgi:hypothetical protein
MNFEETQDAVQESPSSVPSEAGADDGAMDFENEFGGGAKKPMSKNAVILGGLAVVGVAVIWFMFFRGSPQSAQAGATPGDSGKQIQQFLDSGNINLMKQTLKETEKIVQKFRAYPGKTQVPLASLKSNPFRELPPKADGGPVTKRTDDDEAADHAKVVSAVAELHLQSIVRGSKYHACMINNTLYQEGQHVGVFTVAEVATGTVVLESGKYRFELKMQN